MGHHCGDVFLRMTLGCQEAGDERADITWAMRFQPGTARECVSGASVGI